MTRKISFISYSKLTDKIVSEYYLDFLHERGLFVHYIDVTNLLRRDHVDNGHVNCVPSITIKSYLGLMFCQFEIFSDSSLPY